MLHIFLSNRPDDIRYGTSGKPVPGYDARVVDEHDRPVPHGEAGELVVRGDSSADGYWNQRAKTAAPFRANGPTPATPIPATPRAISASRAAATRC